MKMLKRFIACYIDVPRIRLHTSRTRRFFRNLEDTLYLPLKIKGKITFLYVTYSRVRSSVITAFNLINIASRKITRRRRRGYKHRLTRIVGISLPHHRVTIYRAVFIFTENLQSVIGNKRIFSKISVIGIIGITRFFTGKIQHTSVGLQSYYASAILCGILPTLIQLSVLHIRILWLAHAFSSLPSSVVILSPSAVVKKRSVTYHSNLPLGMIRLKSCCYILYLSNGKIKTVFRWNRISKKPTSDSNIYTAKGIRKRITALSQLGRGIITSHSR